MKLHTTGTKIRNEKGEKVLLRGVNCAGLEWDAGNESVLRSALLAADEWGANIIRLPVSQDRWFGWCPEQKDPDSAERYRAFVDLIVGALAERGCYLILDLHWNDRGGQERPERTAENAGQKLRSVLGERRGAVQGLWKRPLWPVQRAARRGLEDLARRRSSHRSGQHGLGGCRDADAAPDGAGNRCGKSLRTRRSRLGLRLANY